VSSQHDHDAQVPETAEDRTSKKNQKKQEIHELVRANQDREALVLIECFLKDYPKDLEVRHHYVRCMIRLGKYDDAASLAEELVTENPERSQYCLSLCRSLLSGERYSECESAARRGLKHNPQDLPLSKILCQCVSAQGRTKEASALSFKLLQSLPEDRALARIRCESLLAEKQYDKAAKDSSTYLSYTPNDPVLLKVRGRALLELGRPAEFCEEVEPPTFPLSANTRSLAGILALSLAKAERWERLIDWLEPSVRAGAKLPDTLQRVLLNAYQRSGRTADAKRAFESLVDSWSVDAPASLTEGLKSAAKYGPPRLPDKKMTEEIIENLWALADHRKWTRAEWLEWIRWGAGAGELLKIFTMKSPENRIEISKYVESYEIEDLRSHVSAGNAVVLTGAHIGPFQASLGALSAVNLPVTVVTNLFVPDDGNRTSIETVHLGSSRLDMVRGLYGAVRKGRAIVIPADNDHRMNAEDIRYRIRLFGTYVNVSVFPPRVAYRHRLRTYWLESCFTDSGFSVSAKRMVEPNDGEGRDEFVARWWGDYLSKYVRYLRGDPRNLYLRTGPVRRAWLGVDEPVHQSRELPLDFELPAQES